MAKGLVKEMKNIFREYDIRGIVDKDLTPKVVELIGCGFAGFIKSKSEVQSCPSSVVRRPSSVVCRLSSVVIGRDVRLSSPWMRDAAMKGMVESGLKVIDIGIVPTPVFYFALHHFNAAGGLMITGSHNPPEFNGFKVCWGQRTIWGAEIQELREFVENSAQEPKNPRTQEPENIQTCEHANILPEYLKFVKERIKMRGKLKVVVDAGNGTAGPVLPNLLRELGCEVIELFCEPDGHFPNHFPDPTIPKYLEELRKTVLNNGADCGLAFDGDADRIGVIDDSGEIIWGDKLLILYSRDILPQNPGGKIVFEVKCSQAVEEEITRLGGIPIMWKTGHSIVENKVREEKALLAGEMSGHIYFNDNYLGYDDAIFAACRLVEILSKTDNKLSQLLADVPKYYTTPEIRVDCADDKKFKVVDQMKTIFAKTHKLIDIDGARILFGDGWGLIRASNTQPVLVLRFEAKTSDRCKEIEIIVMNKLKEVISANSQVRK